MKLTKDTQTVLKFDNGHTIIGTAWRCYFVRANYGIVEYTKREMIEVYGLTEDQFENIEKSGI